MAWNPSPQVAEIRDIATRRKQHISILLYRDENGRWGYVSYGKTVALCNYAQQIADGLLEKAEEIDHVF